MWPPASEFHKVSGELGPLAAVSEQRYHSRSSGDDNDGDDDDGINGSDVSGGRGRHGNGSNGDDHSDDGGSGHC